MKKTKNPTDHSALTGQKITLRTVNNRTLLTNRPVFKPGEPTADQLEVQETFMEAVDYAKQELSSLEGSTFYERDGKKKARTAAISDYLNAPKVRKIDTDEYTGNVGNIIRIVALDDFKVTAVKIVISGSDGNVIEEGEATKYAEGEAVEGGKLFRGKFVASVANPSLPGTTIKVTAYDRPGNKGEMVKVLS